VGSNPTGPVIKTVRATPSFSVADSTGIKWTDEVEARTPHLVNSSFADYYRATQMSMSPRVKTGVVELDKMLSGGFMRGDVVLLAGGAGTGKSTLGMQYLIEGTKEGEHGIYLTFEELPDQLYRDALNMGWDIKQLENEDKLRVICTSPDVLVEPSGVQVILERPIKEIDARRIVVDSLTHLGMFVKSQDMRLVLYRIVMFFKTKHLSSLLCWEASQKMGQSFAVSEEGISFLTDCIVLLKFIEIESGIRKGVVVLKMRGSQHDKSLREYVITSNGIKVSTPFMEYEGLMSGSPRKASRTDDAVARFSEAFTGRKAKGE
jgi:circadian clock protein KaiC